MSGLVSGACFAEFGANVTCLDVDAGKIEALQSGKIPIYEPGLEDLVHRNMQAGRLQFSTQFQDWIGDADLVFIAVGTPTRRGDGHADLNYVYAAATQIAAAPEGLYHHRGQIHRAGGHGAGSQARHTTRPIRRPTSMSPPIPNFCARAPPSTISCAPTAWCWVWRASAPRPCCVNCTARST